VKPEWPKPEAQRADGGGEILGDGEASLLPTSEEVCGNAVSSPSGVRVGAWPLQKVFLYSRGTRGHLPEHVGSQVPGGGMAPLPSILKSAYDSQIFCKFLGEFHNCDFITRLLYKNSY